MLFGRKSIKDVIEECQQIFDLMSEVTACFTGHRAQKLPWKFNEKDPRCVKMKENAKAEIEKAIQRGYTTFLCGMALGFDMICAEIVLELKKKYPNIRLIGAIPCKNQYDRWPQAQIDRYRKLVKQLDGVRCIYDEYVDGCMIERNEYMLNNSSLVIALYNGLGGGTKSTIEKAKKKGIDVVVIKP